MEMNVGARWTGSSVWCLRHPDPMSVIFGRVALMAETLTRVPRLGNPNEQIHLPRSRRSKQITGVCPALGSGGRDGPLVASQRWKVSAYCWQHCALCIRFCSDLKASSLRSSFHNTQRLHESFQVREAANSPNSYDVYGQHGMITLGVARTPWWKVSAIQQERNHPWYWKPS